MRLAPVNDDLACYGQPRRGYLKSSQRIKFREAPAPLDAVETDDVDDGRKGTTQAVKSSAVNLATFCDTTPPPACV